MDISELCTAGAHNEGAEITIIHPVTREKTDLKITLLGIDSKAWRKAQKDMQRKVLAALANKSEIDEDEIEVEALAAVTTEWTGLVKDGQPVKFTKAACKALYKDAPAVRDQVDRFIGDRRNFIKG